MNTFLKNNNLLKNLFLLSLNNNMKLFNEIPHYDSFIETECDIGIGNIDIISKNITEELFEIFKENKQESNTSLILIKPSSKKKEDEIFIPNKNLIIELGNKFNLEVNFIDLDHPFYSQNIIYNFIISVFPSINNYNKEFRYKIIENFCNSLSFGLTERKLFEKYKYKSLITKNKLQNYLLSSEKRFTIPFNQINLILTDYYNVNIIVIIENLLLYNCHHNPNRLSLLYLYYNKKFIVISNNKHFGLFPPEYIKKLENIIYEKNNIRPLDKLYPISKYKLPEIINIAKSLNIQIQKTVSNKSKNKTKLELYNEIITYFPE